MRSSRHRFAFWAPQLDDDIMTLVLNRFFSRTVPQLHMPFMTAPRVPVDQIKLQFGVLLKDCDDRNAQRVGYRITGASTADELWQLRNELHQCISRLHSQSEAATRINSLLSSFEGWIPSRQRVKI